MRKSAVAVLRWAGCAISCNVWGSDAGDDDASTTDQDSRDDEHTFPSLCAAGFGKMNIYINIAPLWVVVGSREKRVEAAVLSPVHFSGKHDQLVNCYSNLAE